MKIAEARIMLERAAKTKPALQALLNGHVTKDNIPAMADACAELGLFELSELLRGVSAADGAQKLAIFVASLDGGSELVDDLHKDFVDAAGGDVGELVGLMRFIRGMR